MSEYDIIDSEGNVVEKAETTPEPIPLERPQEPPTKGQLKLLRKQYVTVQHPRVVACQHRLAMNRQPRMRNCESCWLAWFNEHGELVQQLDEMHTGGHDNIIVALQGTKFFKRWLQFMSTIAQWKQQESNEQVG